MKLSEIKAKTPTERQVIKAWLTRYCEGSVTKVMRDITEMQQNGWGTAVSEMLHLKAETIGEPVPTPPILRLNNFTDLGEPTLILKSFDLTNLNLDWVDSCVGISLNCTDGGTVGKILENTSLFEGVKRLTYLDVWSNVGDPIGSILPYINDKVMFRLGLHKPGKKNFELLVSTQWTNGDHLAQVNGKNYTFTDAFELQDILVGNGYEDLV